MDQNLSPEEQQFAEQARQAGYPPNVIQRYIEYKRGQTGAPPPTGQTAQAAPGAAPAPTVSQPTQSGTMPDLNISQAAQAPAPMPGASSGGFKWQDALPVIGGIGGELIGGPVGGAIGSGLGEAGSELFQGQQLNPGEIGTQAALGGIGGPLLGKLAGGATKLVGKGLLKEGENLTLKSIRPTPGQQATYGKMFGEDIPQTLIKNKMVGAGLPEIEQHIGSLQGQFDEIAKNTSAPVSPTLFYQTAANTLGDLAQSSVPSNKTLAEGVKNALMNIHDSLGNGPITLGKLTDIRRQFDQATADSQFKGADWGVNRITGDILRRTIQGYADEMGLQGAGGESLKELGGNLQKFYMLRDIAQAKQYLGKANQPFGLMPVLEFIAGQGLGEKAASGLFGPGAGMIGGVAGIAAGAALNHPAVGRAVAKASYGAGEKLANGLMPPIQQVVGQEGARLPSQIGMVSQPEVNNGEGNNAQNQTHIDPSSLPQGVQIDNKGNVQLPGLSGHSVQQDYTYQDYVNDMNRAGMNPIAQEAIRGRYEASRGMAQSQIDTQGLSPAETDFMRRAQVTNQNMNQLRQLILQKGPNFFQSFLNDNPTVQSLRAKSDPDYALMATLMQNLKGQSVRAVEGGRPSNFDLKILNSMPTPGDTTGSALAKLNQAQQVLAEQYMINMPYYGMNTNTMPDIQAGQ